MGYFGQGALGATGSGDLSVRYYPTVSGWASYQSPESDRILRALQGEIRRGGMLIVDADGIIQGADLVAAKLFAINHKGITTPLIGASLGQYGGRVDTAARALEAVAASAELLAERGNVAYGYVKAINDATGKVPVLPPAIRPSPTPTTPSPAVPPGAQPGPPPSELVATLKSPIGIAAVGIAVALLLMNRGGRRRRR